MQDKEELRQAVSVGIDAQALLSNKLLSSIFYSRKNSACEAFMRTNDAQDKQRKELWQSVQGVIAIERELQELVKTGKIAEELLSGSNELKKTNVHSPFEG